jgi:signal transduction histidine kinase
MLKILRGTSVRLALGYMALFAASSLIMIGFLWWRTAGYLDRRTDAAIRADVREITGVLGDFGVKGAVDTVGERATDTPDANSVYLLTDSRFEPLAGNLVAWPLQVSKKPGWYWAPLVHGGSTTDTVRLLVAKLPNGLNLLVGRGLGDRAELRQLIIDALYWAGASAFALAIAGGLLLRRAVLRRVALINAAATAIVQGDLERRVPTRGSPDAFDELARTINLMLHQIQQLVEGIKNTSNAVAHDLRTPLAELRARLETLLRARPPLESTFAEIHHSVADIDRVIAVFNALLRLAEIDSGVRRSGFRQVDLAMLVTEAAEIYSPLAEEKQVCFAVHTPDDLRVNGDPHLLAQAIGNLADNAVKYAPSGSEVSLTANLGSAGHVELVVADSGPGIADAEKRMVIHRFYRCRRDDDETGIGLGLALVDAVARLHEGGLSLHDNHPGLVAVLTLPSAAPDYKATHEATKQVTEPMMEQAASMHRLL